VLLTKSDKLTRSEAAKSLAAAEALLPQLHPMAQVQLFSAVKATGQRHAQNVIGNWLTA
jgi:GTP-binding protein